MSKFIANLRQAWQQSIVVFGLMMLISLSGLFIFVQQPSYAAQKLTPEAKIDRAYEYSEATGINEEKRQEEYEQLAKDAESPQTLEKAYERNVKAYKEENPQPNLLEKAEEVVEKVTGK